MPNQTAAWLIPILQVAAQAQQLRQQPTWAHAAQMAGLQVPQGMANIPIQSEPHQLIPALAQAARYGAEARQTEALTVPRAQVYQAQAQAYEALGRQREAAANVNVAREQQIQTEVMRTLQFLDVEYQTALANLERARQQAETERARTGYVTAQTQTLLNESEAEVQRILAARDAMQQLANLRGVQAATEQALLPYQQAALAGLAFQREASGQRSLAAAEQTQALTPYLIQKAQQEARLVGARADQVERLTPVLVEVQQANADAARALAENRRAGADLATAKAQTEIMTRSLLIRQQELINERYAEQIRQVIAATELTQAQKEQVLARIEDDRQKTMAYLALQEAKLGTDLALQAYHQARTGYVEADTERLRAQLPLELQILANRADSLAAEIVLLHQRAETERARTGQVQQQTRLDLERAQAELREIESRIMLNAERAEVYRRQHGLLQARTDEAELRRQLLEATMPGQIRRTEAEARRAEAQAAEAEVGARVAEATEAARIRETEAEAERAAAAARRAGVEATVAEATAEATIRSANAAAERAIAETARAWTAAERENLRYQLEQALLPLQLTEADLRNQLIQAQIDEMAAEAAREGELHPLRLQYYQEQIRNLQAQIGRTEAETEQARVRTEMMRLDLDARTQGHVEDLSKHPAVLEYWKLIDTWRQMAGDEVLNTWEILLLPQEAREAYLAERRQGVPPFMEWLRQQHPESLPIVTEAITLLGGTTPQQPPPGGMASVPAPGVPAPAPAGPAGAGGQLTWPSDLHIARQSWKEPLLRMIADAGGAMVALSGVQGLPDEGIVALGRDFGMQLRREDATWFREALVALLVALAERGY